MNRRPSEEGPLEPELFELDAGQNPQILLDQQRENEADHDGSDDYLSVDINTPRMWILSLLFAVFGSSINLFFSLRYPSVSISPIIALLVAHPLGLLWDHVFPFSAEYYVESGNRPGSSVRRGSLDESSPLLSPSSVDFRKQRHRSVSLEAFASLAGSGTLERERALLRLHQQ
jgi:OPT oligopeptide transporter protein